MYFSLGHKRRNTDTQGEHRKGLIALNDRVLLQSQEPGIHLSLLNLTSPSTSKALDKAVCLVSSQWKRCAQRGFMPICLDTCFKMTVTLWRCFFLLFDYREARGLAEPLYSINKLEVGDMKHTFCLKLWLVLPCINFVENLVGGWEWSS